MKQKIYSAIVFLFLFVFAFCIGLQIGPRLSGTAFIILLLGIPVWLILIVNLHEIGHLLFGRISGYGFMAYKVGPVTLKRENDKYVIRKEKMSGFAGYCMMTPPKTEVAQWKNLLYYGGGIIINLLTGGIAILMALFIPGMHDNILLLLWLFAFLSLGLGLINLLPAVSGNNPNDGMIIFSILQKNKLATDFIRINQLSSKLLAGIRPRDITELGDMPKTSEEMEGLSVYLLLYHLFNAYDSDNQEKIDTCAQLFENNLHKIPTAIEPPVFYELCFIYSLKGNPEKATEYYNRAKNILEKDNDLNGNRVKAYYAWYIKNDPETARMYCERALSVVDKYPLPGQRPMELDFLHKLQAQLQ
ncbi:hypothetical protein M2459_001514 [Parabacteroides sp. PF5-5]|uniref:site-2 protease family protein n=1 Tax=unclassified Parabacteroides TaxID=2649774 RepID=UPI002474CD4A|nr:MULTISPECIES: site-2 protease family protein [unclassified Parabacteroides]MDH6304777.1 hypothetical protein [Parabacteroides sp. PH5-39]MDH6315608.1 hypothetical protein [Parabacteroides sp. PF5-13]MDH6319269.1 hypothetical protein [Parabacteroides sp. PH5-13]MDH6323000.1 hypothetical protein [Parabacteroides sp. PH5-8]MDH6326801.1 hypothetical protein [Parabacteroides sp. PH5-41]